MKPGKRPSSFQGKRQTGFFLLLLAALLAAWHPVSAQTVLREYWSGVPGYEVRHLLSWPDFPGRPTGSMHLDALDSGQGTEDFIGARIRGYLHPPLTGEYVFWISSDDRSQLFLSTDDRPENIRQIATVVSYTGPHVWEEPRDGNAQAQKSKPIRLESGRRYYFEVLHKEGAGEDHCAVGWQLPGGHLERPIPGRVLSGPHPGIRLTPFQIHDTAPQLLSQPQDLTVEEGQTAWFQVTVQGAEPISFQWQAEGVDLQGATATVLQLPNATRADHGRQFRCRVTNGKGEVLTRTATLSVLPETRPPAVLQLTPPSGARVTRLAQIAVLFDEPVLQVRAEDLLANGLPAVGVSGSNEGPYLFELPELESGPVEIRWSGSQSIRDLSVSQNRFAGGVAAQYELVRGASRPQLLISEMLASNQTGLQDDEGDREDWIELWNAGATPVNLTGWRLSERPGGEPAWTFPSRTLGPGEHLLVFASGKNRRGEAWHADFQLGAGGGQLLLLSADMPPEVIDRLDYPSQRRDVSYGRDRFGRLGYFLQPTPGALNREGIATGSVAEPRFNVQRGFFTEPFTLALHCSTPGAVICYTTDGSEPVPGASPVYTAALPISATTLVRAAAWKEGLLPSRVVTHSYFFHLSPALRSLPVLSLVTDSHHLTGRTGLVGMEGGTYLPDGVWAPVAPGDYYNPTNKGRMWERPVSMEFLEERGSTFQIDAGLRLHASSFRRPRLNSASKFSWRVYFRGDYGASRLDFPFFPGSPVQSFECLVLRAGTGDRTNPFIRDELFRRIGLDMGRVESRGTFVNLFINGVYQGYYNPVERIDEDFLRSWHRTPGDWDLIKQQAERFGDHVDAGDDLAWNSLQTLIRTGDLRREADYRAVQQLLDLPGFVDYLLQNIYAANGDWPDNNWYAARSRSPEGRFRFYSWDAEFAFGNQNRPVSLNTLTQELGADSARRSEIAGMFQALSASAEFRLLFADRAQKHLFQNGALTNARILQRFQELRDALFGVLPHMFMEIPEVWIEQRREHVLAHLAAAGLLSPVAAPELSRQGGRVSPGYSLALTAPAGMVYYTWNGEDPRLPGGGIHPGAAAASEAPLTLSSGGVLRARTLQEGTWSALVEAEFHMEDLLPPLRITEIMYNPPGGDAYEFLEILNDGAAPLEVGGYRLQGVTFAFPPGAVLQPGQRVVLISSVDPAAFSRRYPRVEAAGRYTGSLANGGERLAILDRADRTVFSVHYDDEQGWPVLADGGGASLEAMSREGEPSEPAGWRSSPYWGGSPGEAASAVPIPSVVIHELQADNRSRVQNGQSFPPWVELKNVSGTPQDLAGWILSDGLQNFTLPAGTLLEPGGHLVVWCDSETTAPGLHAGFSLRPSGGSVLLFNTQSERVSAVSYGFQLADYALGWVDGAWTLTVPTPGSANSAALLAPPDALRFSEWLANAPPGQSDWLELQNTSSLPVALHGLFLGTHKALDPLRSFSFVGPGDYLQLLADELPGPGHVDFKLPAEGGRLELWSAAGERLDAVEYGPQSEGRSEGRLSSSTDDRAQFQIPTPGKANLPLPAGNSTTTQRLIRMTDRWKFDQSGNDLGTAWRQPSYSDASWREGPGLLYSEWSLLSEPKNTYLRLTNDSGACVITYYFRKRFHVDTRQGTPSLRLTTLFDDGAVVYLNGQEIYRVRMHPGPPGSGDLAEREVDNTFKEGPFELPGAALLNGENLIAVEIHQGSALTNDVNADVVMGLQLEAVFERSNGPAIPVQLHEILAAGVHYTNAWGTVCDWIELRNTGSAPASLGGMSLTDDPAHPRRWVIPAGVEMAAGGYRVIYCDPGRAPSAAAEPFLNTGFGLKQKGERLYLFAPQEQGGGLIDSVEFGNQLPDRTLARGSAGQWRLAVPTEGFANQAISLGDPMRVRINEWSTGSGADWFELFNPDASPVDLGGHYLTDQGTLDGRTQFQVRAHTYVESAGFLVWQADGNVRAGSDHVPFRLHEEGDLLRLYSPGLQIVDSVSPGPQPPGRSEGRWMDGSSTIALFAEPSPGRRNYLPVTQALIHEVLSHTDAPYEDAVELHNPTGVPADISHWWLSDDDQSLQKYRIPAGTVIPAGGYRVFYEYQFKAGGIPFALNGTRGDQVVLSSGNAEGQLTGYRAVAAFGPAENGVSFGRHTVSGIVEFVPLQGPTFGIQNPAGTAAFRQGQGAPNAPPRVGPVVVSEIMYAPSGTTLPGGEPAEFVELQNASGTSVALFDPAHPGNRWRIRGGIEFDFPPAQWLAPGERLVLVPFNPQTQPATAAAFRARYGAGELRLLGPYQGRLDNAGDEIRLLKPDAPETEGPDAGWVPYVLVERIVYRPATPWPPSAAGRGASLHRASLLGYANDPGHWTAGVPTPGSTRGSGDEDGDGLPDAWEFDHGTDPRQPADASLDSDGDGLTDLEEFLRGSDPRNPRDPWNTAPYLSAIPDQALQEDVPSGWIAFSMADLQTAASDLAWSASSSNPLLIPDFQIEVSGEGEDRALRITPAANRFGVAFITLRVSDGLFQVERTFQVTVAAVNDPPEISSLGPQRIRSGVASLPLAFQIEDLETAAEDLVVSAESSNPALIPVEGLTFGGSGSFRRLTIRPAENASGSATLLLRVSDGALSSTTTFQVQVIDFELRADHYSGLIFVPEDVRFASSGKIRIATTTSGRFTATGQLGGAPFTLTGELDPVGRARGTIIRRGLPTLQMDFTVDTSAQEAEGTVSTESWTAIMRAGREPYNSRNPAPAGLSRFTALLSGNASGPAAPEGWSYGQIAVNRSGLARFTGVLADGTRLSFNAPLVAGGEWPVYATLYKNQGLLIGWAFLGEAAGEEELQGEWQWIKPPAPADRYYPGGFSLRTTFIASPYSPPGSGIRAVDLPSGMAEFHGGNLPADFANAFTLTSANKFVIQAPSPQKLALQVNRGSGALTGSFVHPGTQRTVRLKGVVLQQQKLGGGHFLGPNASGSVLLHKP